MGELYRPYYKRQYFAGLANCGYSRAYYPAGMFNRAEWTDNWEPHLHCVRQMFPNFHAAGHIAYAKSAHHCLYPTDARIATYDASRRVASIHGERLLHNSVTGEILELIVFRPNHRAIWSRPTRRYVIHTSHKYSADTTQV